MLISFYGWVNSEQCDADPVPKWLEFLSYQTPRFHLLLHRLGNHPYREPGNVVFFLFFQSEDAHIFLLFRVQTMVLSMAKAAHSRLRRCPQEVIVYNDVTTECACCIKDIFSRLIRIFFGCTCAYSTLFVYN